MAHFAGLLLQEFILIFEYADVVTSTTHKTLRGPRGGIILQTMKIMQKKLIQQFFPVFKVAHLCMLFAQRLLHLAKLCNQILKIILSQVVKNSKTLSEVMLERGLEVVSGGTDTHLVLVDLRPKKFTGKDAKNRLRMLV